MAVRIAAAPISWGVCEVPGWGKVLDREVVLGEMAELGLRATELGPPGYLPTEPAELRAALGTLRLVGGFYATVLHDEQRQASSIAEATELAELLASVGGEVLVLAAATGLTGYDERPALSAAEWRTLVETCALIRDAAAEHGLATVLHPHVGTHVERADEVARFVADSDLPLCLDTGHLLIGGADPVTLAREHPERIGHVHLKDVRADLADRVRSGEISYTQAVAEGIYVPLGAGDVDLLAMLSSLSEVDYRGWYVLEQDTALPQDGTADEDLPRRDTEQSLARLHELLRATGAEV
ncbi:2-keto-myo-inositol dehydratase [Tamaricihabitans halophyticus]|uniref:2-keto-myo-inositol dehydratase n=1 Tax=Tamaricihabitans halophyticus TaxID=1262583 RepID=A0A4R2QX85_9PSEU|nr:TIM barrel protein [Tamaricihabitans halophyticus]TCP54337.1 2-keto-myo-inositol dehydratase [Tamaricihabitans halophyticus]